MEAIGPSPGGPSLLQSLPVRPPTPPREAHHDSDLPLRQEAAAVCHLVEPRLSLQTPPNVYSPPESTNTASSRRKKVEFSAQTEHKEPPVYVDGTAAAVRQNPTPVSAPPPSSSKPVKSILKTACPANPLDPNGIAGDPHGDAVNGANLVGMLDSTIQQLAGSDRDSKRDAYMMLVRALRASNNLPDRIALQDKMSLFMQFIQRDTTSKTPGGCPDSALINHALTLLGTFLHFPAIASTLSNDFGVFVIDHCIRSFEDGAVPKDVVRHLMHVVALQNFSPKVMTSDRVGRLVAALHAIENHLTGKSIIMSRVLIYRRLVKQCRPHMVAHSDWLLDLFTDMLSPLREIRSSAVSLGLEAAFALGREKQVSRRVVDIFQLCPEDKTYLEYYARQLQSMTEDKQQSPFVPQIWSVVILFLRSPDKWKHFGAWLLIIQACFNSGDYQTKQEANYAWNRLVYALHVDGACSAKIMSTLVQPLTSQLRRRGTAKHAEDLRRVVLGGVCNLFYYAFRPTANLAHLDLYWDNCVRPLVQKLSERPPEETRQGLVQAAAVLTGLFDCSTPRLWREDRVAESPLARPDELPAIDAKWLRRNAPRVFASVHPILDQSFLDVGVPRSCVHKLWSNLVGAVASAASKEIKVSKETADFIGHVLGLIDQIWTRGLRHPDETGKLAAVKFLASMRELILTMVESLGFLPFTEKLFWRDEQNSFVPLATPSHRSAKGHGASRTPLHHLFAILSSLPPMVPDDDDFADFLHAVFAPFFAAKGDRGQMDLAREMLQLVPMDALCPWGAWQLVAEKIAVGLDPSQRTHRIPSSAGDTPLGNEYRDVLRVLERGLQSIPRLPWAHWRALFCTLCVRVRDETGDAGLAICVIEPLAKLLLDLQARNDNTLPANALGAVTELISAATQPRDRQAVDSARRRLWGTANTGSRSSSADPFDHLYKLVSFWLAALYEKDIGQNDVDEVAVPLIAEVSAFFERSNAQLFIKTLVVLQDGMAPWIRDDQMKLGSRLSSAVAESTKLLWDNTCSRLGAMARPLALPLESLETLLCAAFDSKHRHIVNTMSTLWNRVFDGLDDVAYPEQLKALLLSRRPFLDIVLPGLEEPSIESGARQPAFIDSQEDMDVLNNASRPISRPPSRPTSSRESLSPLPGKLSLPMKRPLEAAPTSSASKVARRGPALLRHDDSQIQFAPIDSSPRPANLDESQVLTERQKEVRERQRETGALCPEIRPSASPVSVVVAPEPSSPPASRTTRPEQPRAATPDAEGDFDDFITSTPTPRRGQALAIAHVNDPTDPPSSPPEPRRYPLLPEIQSRSNSNSILDDWQFTSSPISGSPTTARQATPELPSQSVSSEISMDGQAQPIAAPESVEPSTDVSADVVEDDTEEDAEPQLEGQPAAAPEEAGPESPSTPRRSLRPMPRQETPRSEADVFVDALTTPGKPSPEPTRLRPRRSSRATRAKNDEAARPEEPSLVVSEIDERSLLRLVIEVDEQSKRNLPSTSSAPPDVTAAPDIPAEQIAAGPEQHAEVEVLECIEVKTRYDSSPGLQTTPARPKTPTTNSTPVEGVDPSTSRNVARSGRKKRARSSSNAEASGGRRKSKRCILEQAPEPEPEHGHEPELEYEVPDSQGMSAAQVPNVEAVEEQQDEQPPPSSVETEAESHGPTPAVVEGPESLPDVAAIDPVEAVESTREEDLELQSQIALEQEAQNLRELDVEMDILTADDAPMEDASLRGAVEEYGDGSGQAEEGMGGSSSSSNNNNTGLEMTEFPEMANKNTAVGLVMGKLQGTLDALRGAALTRNEVYRIEDMFMDIKRELYDAERRGRRQEAS